MKEIIKKGEIPEIKKYIKICHHCDTAFTYTLDDTYMTSPDEECVGCPLCKKDNVILFKRRYRGGSSDDRSLLQKMWDCLSGRW